MLAHHSFDTGPTSGTRRIEGEITVLHVDDEPAFGEMCAELLEQEGELLTVETATSAVEGLEYLDEGIPDCIVSDYDMPRMDGLEFLEEVRRTYPELPFILFTGKGSEEIASEAISAGVTDYLQKGTGTNQYGILRNRIRNSVASRRSRRSLQLFRSAVEHSGHSIYITDTDGTIEYVNPSFTEITGYTAEEAVGETPAILKSGRHDHEFYADLWETVLEGKVWESEIVNRRKNGELYVADQTIAPIFVGEDEPEKFVAVNRKITDRKQYLAALERHHNNLEALNRMLRYRIRDDLQAVTGYTELLGDYVDDEGSEYLEILEERSWEVFDRIEAARDLTDTLNRMEAKQTTELGTSLERAATTADSIAEDISVDVPTDIESTPIASDTILESIVRILTEKLIRSGSRSSEVRISATEHDEHVSVRVAGRDAAGIAADDGTQGIRLAPDRDFAGMDTTERYIVRGLIDGLGGEIRMNHDDQNGIWFVVEFPVRQFLAETV
jgi:PAS domain S-box-containing protein